MPSSRVGRSGATIAATAVVATAVTFSGCSSSNAGGSGQSGRTGTSDTTQTSVILSSLPGVKTLSDGKQYVIVAGRQIILPTEVDGNAVTSQRATGQQVLLTTSGPWPQQLFAHSAHPIVFTNVTSVPVTVTFEHYPVAPHVVAPAGGTWSWKAPGLISIDYKDSRGGTGNLSVDVFP